MSSRDGICLCCAALALTVIAPGTAAAKAGPITGTLAKPGYTVLAVAANGKATSVRVRGRKFRLRPPAKRVTLHLRATNGRYVGPIVIRGGGRRVVLGVRAGARLGRIKLGRGYARLARRLLRKWVDKRRVARAKRGVPIGARRFGLVRSRHARGRRGDPDLDGIPNPLDVDDDGDRILDNLERSSGARAAQTDAALQLMNVLPGTIDATANANAVGLGATDSDSALSQQGYLIITNVAGRGEEAELDCGGEIQQPPRPEGLRYCTPGGSGGVFGTTPELKFPEGSDPDGDGFGTLVPNPTLPPPGSRDMFLHHHATSAEIRTGDVLIERVTKGAVEVAYPATLQYVFATIPALVSYSDTASNSAVVRYPVHSPNPTPSDAGPGALGNGFPVAPGPDGHIRLTLTFWRPQRLRTVADPGTGEWIDIGGLSYQASLRAGQPGGGPVGGLTDLAPDRPADPANKLSFTVDITPYLKSPGDEEPITLTAIAGNGTDHADQMFWVKRR